MKIELRNVTKQYGAIVALRDVTLDIESGAKVALAGPNGSGKSTLIRALAGMLRTEGQVHIDGQDPYRDRNRLAPSLSYMPQTQPQFSFTVGEMIDTVRLVRELPPGRIEECAEFLQLDLKPILGKAVKHLSGGMKQKLTLSLALAPEPRLLILDEPTASLDAGTRERLYQLIQQRAGSATLILSSHRLEEIRHLSDEVIVMENGTITRRCHVETYVDSVQPLEESRIHAVA